MYAILHGNITYCVSTFMKRNAHNLRTGNSSRIDMAKGGRNFVTEPMTGIWLKTTERGKMGELLYAFT
jgi:hypothetical protein